MASAISANKAELLAIANAVASEKMIDKSIVIEAMGEKNPGRKIELLFSLGNKFSGKIPIIGDISTACTDPDLTADFGTALAPEVLARYRHIVLFDRQGQPYRFPIQSKL